MDPNNDIFSDSLVTTFADGSSQTTATVVIINDNIPEGNETFTLTISGLSSGAQTGTRPSMQLIIRASDEPYGSFQYNTVSHLPTHPSIHPSMHFTHSIEFLVGRSC